MNAARSQIVTALRAVGVAPYSADLIVDIAIHAAQQALLTLKRHTDSLHGKDSIAAANIALQLLENLCQTNAAELQDKMQAEPPWGSVEIEMRGKLQ